MDDEKKFKVTLSGDGFSYSVEVIANEEMKLEQLRDLAAKKIKEKYGFDVPLNEEVEIQFEIID